VESFAERDRPPGRVRIRAENILRLPIFETALRGIKVVCSLVGTRVDLAETFELHADGRTEIVRETRSLNQVNEAMAEVEAGRVEARLVFELRP
jgi:propanol-preferring alcohol dehydrogenase